jgi:hypothetical protein
MVLGYASVVVKLPGWHKSRGACLEVSVAESLGKRVVCLEDFLAEHEAGASVA